MASVVIAGGGIIGLSIAWRAAQHGLDVTLADPAPGSGATRAAAGMLTPVAEAAYAEEKLLRLGQDSLRAYPAFAQELTSLTGLPTGLRLTGTLQIAYDRDDLAVIEETHALQSKFGVAARRLTASQCRQLEPMLAPGISGGLLTENDGSVDPRLLVTALLKAADLSGVALIKQKVTSVAPHAAVLADGTKLSADWIVLATGHACAELTAVPVRPVKGQILRLRGQRLLNRSIRGTVRGARVYLVPREDGELVVGATQEEMGTDTTVTAGALSDLLRDARTLLPGITELEFAEAIAGLRPGTPDNAPILGRSGTEGVLLATGHFRSGVLLAPATADLMTALMTLSRAGSMDTFSPERFG
jgi:glycine oxidase